MTTTDTSNSDPLATAAQTAWLEYAKGTYSSTDQRIFLAGLMAGCRYLRQREKKEQRYRADYDRLYGRRRDCY